ncbi:ankyrin repeat-containing domain protein [Lasiosphaeria ovina]|uniref:Ankyrin repeat-containing domain protein n=1 Tax=Lasiosphaeria ovina TaxID=92902 RepID=A0AAE0TUY8_9PEZI|nr:ankyrin repeat-containing domain protein [Lasiosphaeria ovina]
MGFKRFFAKKLHSHSKAKGEPVGGVQPDSYQKRAQGAEAGKSSDKEPETTPKAAPPLLASESTLPSTRSPEGTIPGSSRIPNGHGETTIRNLWATAYENLRKENGELIAKYEKNLAGSLPAGLGSALGMKAGSREQMEAILKSKIDEVNRDAWKLEFGSHEFLVRDMAKPVLGIISAANVYITDALSVNPYASIAWAGISLFLPLLLNPSEEGERLAKGLDYVSSLIVQSRMREDLYVRRYESKAASQEFSRPSHTGYKETLELLYRRILKFQAASYCYYSQNGAFRLGLDMVKWNDWDDLVAEVREQHDRFSQIAEIWQEMKDDEEREEAGQRHHAVVQRWDTMDARLVGLREAIENAQADHGRRELLQWLCDVDHSQPYNSAIDKRKGGTGNWLVEESEEFKNWMVMPRSLLWLHGKAGSGKSILSASVIETLKNRHRSDPKTAIAYYYFSFADLNRQNAAGMLASLVKQLCASRPDTPQSVKSLGEYKRKGERPETKTLETMLEATVCGFTTVYLVIDALDECPALGGHRARLLDIIHNVISTAPENLRVFCTSRRESDIDAVISRLLSPPSRAAIDLSKRRNVVNGDIALYIDRTLATSHYSSWPESIKDDAKRSLIEKSDGMFQYVVCQFEALQRLSSKAAIDSALNNLPDGLDATYDRMLQAVHPDFQPHVLRALKWLAFCDEDVRLETLAEVFIICPERDVAFDEKERLFKPEDVLKYLSGLVEVWVPFWGFIVGPKEEEGVNVRLAHFSIQEYLTSSRVIQGPAAAFNFSEIDSRLHIARACIAYHFYLIDTRGGDENARHDVLGDEYCRWLKQLEKVPRQYWTPDIVRDAIRALTMGSQSLKYSVRNVDAIFHRRWPHCYTSLFGAPNLTDMLLSKLPGTNQYIMQEHLDAALQDAAAGWSIPVIELLLKNGANINAETANYGDALQAALWPQSPYSPRDPISPYRPRDPAMMKPVVKLLLGRGFKLTAPHGKRGFALHIAAAQSLHDIMRLLLDRGADPNAKSRKEELSAASEPADRQSGILGPWRNEYPWDDPPSSALYAAASAGDEAGCLLLLENGAKVHDVGGRYGSPLQAACESLDGFIGDRAKPVIRLLLDRGANVNQSGGKYGPPLQVLCAMMKPDLKLVTFLLEKGADVNAQGGLHGNALQAVCGSSRRPLELLQLLLTRGADVNALGGEYGSALQAACASREGFRVVELLLSHGAEVNLLGGKYGSALQAACASWKGFPMVELLLSRGADVNVLGGEYGSALQAACAGWESFRVVDLLLSRGADVNVLGGKYGSAPQAACASLECFPVVDLLLSRGADVNVLGGKYGSALQAACASLECFPVVELLLSRGADVNVLDREYGSALQAACLTGNRKVVQLLLDHGAEINAEGGSHGTALQAACSTVEVDTARLLIERGADIHASCGPLGGAWHTVAASWNLFKDDSVHAIPLMQLLLKHGVEINNKEGKLHPTALHAVQEGPGISARVKFLLDHEANVNISVGEHGTPLQFAFATGKLEYAKLLLESCPDLDVNAQGGVFNYALQAAAYAGEAQAVQLLLDKGADVNAGGGKYGSALHAAITKGFWDIVDILLEAGAKTDVHFLSETEEDWLARMEKEYGRIAVEQYRTFQEVQRNPNRGCTSCEDDLCWWKIAGYHT